MGRAGGPAAGPGRLRRVALAPAAVALVAGIIAVLSASGPWAVIAGSASLLTVAAAAWASAGEAGTQGLPIEADGTSDEAGDRSGLARTASEDLLGAEVVDAFLSSRVAVARRAFRPLSVLYFEVYDVAGAGDVELLPLDLGIVVELLRRTLREADIAGIADSGCYVVVLEDTGEDGAVWTAERLRRNVQDRGNRRFRAGVASYPTHGLDGAELQLKAAAALVAARDWGNDRIEVAGL